MKGSSRDVFHGHTLPEDWSLYLHAPTVTDPSLAPPGGEAFYVLSPVPHLGLAPIDWETEGPAYADRILASLEGLLPDLRKHVVTRRIFTPARLRGRAQHLSRVRLLRSHQGSPRARGSAPTIATPGSPACTSWARGLIPGAGVPGVINSAKATCNVIAEDLRL